MRVCESEHEWSKVADYAHRKAKKACNLSLPICVYICSHFSVYSFEGIAMSYVVSQHYDNMLPSPPKYASDAVPRVCTNVHVVR